VAQKHELNGCLCGNVVQHQETAKIALAVLGSL